MPFPTALLFRSPPLPQPSSSTALLFHSPPLPQLTPSAFFLPLQGPRLRHNEQKGFSLGGHEGVALTTGEMISFDFHRELHRIAHVPASAGGKENEGHRICMKVHYVIYPRFLGPVGRLLGRMSVHYNQNFRSLFLSTLEPNHPVAKFMAFQVILFTAIFDAFESKVGWTNVCYLLIASAISLLTRSYALRTSPQHPPPPPLSHRPLPCFSPPAALLPTGTRPSSL